MFTSIGGWAVRRARLVLALAAVAVIAFGVLGAGAFGVLKSGGFSDPSADSTRAQQLLDQRFGGGPDLVLLVSPRSGTVDDPAVARAGSQVVAGLSAEPGVTGVLSYWTAHVPTLRAADGRSALVLAHVGDDDRAATLIKRHAVDTSLLTVRAGGGAAVGGDIGRQVTGDLALAEAIAVPITLILLVLAFGSVVAALLPLVVGLLAVLATFAELAVLGRITDVSIFAINLTTALGLGLGIDYALLVVSRFREELAGGSPVAAAVVRTVETAGRTIAFSAATVMAALAALLVFPLFFLRSFAYAGIGVVAVAAVAGLVVLPAVLAVLGARVNALRLPWSHAVRGSEAPFWGRLAGAVMRRPLLAGGAVVALLLVLASPLAHVTFGTPDDRVLPATASSRVVGEAIRTSYTSKDSSAVSVVTDGRAGTGPLAGYAAVLSRIGHVQRVDSAAGVFAAGRLVLPPGPLVAPLGTAQGDELRVVLGVDAQSSAAERVVHAVRATPSPPGVRALVGGQSAELVDSKAAVGARLPWAGLLIAVTTFILLFLFTGSVLQPVRALVLNALTLSATLGAAVWVFQDGHLSSLLGFTPLPTDISMPVLLFCIAFGLSMDYEVFLISRVKELHDAGMDTVSATTHGLARTGRIVSTAAGLLAVSFFAFGTSRVSFIQLFGLGTGLAILLDATLVRGVLVPAVLAVAGERGWWAPRGLRRVYARVGLSEG